MAAGVSAAQEIITERKIDCWKKKLLDTGRRNRMIHYRETKRTALKILEPGPEELFNLLAFGGRTLTFQRPVSKDSDFRTCCMLALLETLSCPLSVYVGDIKAEGTVLEREKTLGNLRSRAKLAQEEQGIQILYLCFGFLLWREHSRESAPWLKSPLLLMPVQLGVKSLNAPYTIRRNDDEIVVNPTLAYLFHQNYGIDLPVFELKNRRSFESYLEQIEEILDKKGWKLIREVSLGLLSFLKISMYHDLNDHRDQMMNAPLIRAIAGDAHALGELPAGAGKFNIDKTDPADRHEVMDADSSQEEAIHLSRLGASFVMQGPPGTGKSQTITNIIAEALGDGKKVLFVSEKAAALQVVLKRLTAAGLDDFCLSLHSYKANKRQIIDNIGANLSLSPGYEDRSAMEELTQLFHDRRYLNTYAKELHQKIEPFGESVYTVLGRLAQLSDASAIEFKLRDPANISREEFASLLRLADAFEKALNAMEGPLTENPWADTSAASSGQMFRQQMMHAADGLAGDLGEMECLIAYLNQNYGCCLNPAWSDVKEQIEAYEAVTARPLHQAKLEQLTEQVLSEWGPEILEIDSAAMQSRFKTEHTGLLRRWKASYRKDIRQMRTLSRSAGAQIGDAEIINVLQLLGEIRAEKEFLAACEGICAQPKMQGLADAVSADAAKRAEAERYFARIRALMEKSANGFAFFDRLFPLSDMKNMVLHAAAEKVSACMNGYAGLPKWLDLVEAKKACDEKGLGDFTGRIIKRNNTVRDVRKAFERGFYMQWLSLAIADVPSVQTFRRSIHEHRLGEFVRLDEKQFEISRQRIRESIIKTFPDRNAAADAGSELGILRREMEKKRRIMPLRRLFHEIPSLLLTLKPCLMMSPLSVAYFLNAEDYHFDMVIFDEASQIFPEDAVGAIFRADQVIIAGDTKQLPPTNFFSAGTGSGVDEYDDEDADEYADGGYDSILEEAAGVLPCRTLRWHYRSRHENLIAFSNREIYRGELITFPGCSESGPDTGVEFIFVEDGCYEGRGKNCNVPEAKRCADLVREHIEKHPDRSLGIIAFSEKQQEAISREIRKLREQNPEYERFFAEDKEEAFFIKNLENVQGDERDTIFFSIGYAKTKEQKDTGKPMAMRFGPLGAAGGERRLNVAVTRAKTNLKLISSILPSDLDLSRTQSEGIRLLRSYIEFAMNGGAAPVSARHAPRPDELVNAIQQFLTDKGYKTRAHVGCSEYRIDLAVEHPEIPGMFAAGVECDGYSYVSAKTARDRDRLRGSVLREMGWNLYRIWSVEWFRDPESEGQKLLQFIRSAIDAANEPTAANGQAAANKAAAANEPAAAKGGASRRNMT